MCQLMIVAPYILEPYKQNTPVYDIYTTGTVITEPELHGNGLSQSPVRKARIWRISRKVISASESARRRGQRRVPSSLLRPRKCKDRKATIVSGGNRVRGCHRTRKKTCIDGVERLDLRLGEDKSGCKLSNLEICRSTETLRTFSLSTLRSQKSPINVGV